MGHTGRGKAKGERRKGIEQAFQFVACRSSARMKLPFQLQTPNSELRLPPNSAGTFSGDGSHSQ